MVFSCCRNDFCYGDDCCCTNLVLWIFFLIQAAWASGLCILTVLVMEGLDGSSPSVDPRCSGISIALGALIGLQAATIFLGWFVYSRTPTQARTSENERLWNKRRAHSLVSFCLDRPKGSCCILFFSLVLLVATTTISCVAFRNKCG